VRGTSHWVSVEHCLDAEVRIYDHLFLQEDPGDLPEGGEFTDNLNPGSLRTITAKVEPSLAAANPGDRCQFLRQGYFCVDLDSEAGALVFNRTVALRDSWARQRRR
jgi:glutaminyl-tRNA synthetase